ncbi:hypothetical protein HNQ07_000131 [Deinococcus metalli]|uniref:Uncharacterized protein n=1 Tax=Deinococcus metalli TaxID=1141878 RepID=A0A7W8KAJ5_9DEIO|nr:hypothetical protein [Deinococcus metalli]
MPQPSARNIAAARELARAWAGPAGPVVNGEGEWAEDALLLPAARLRDAVALGRRFGQAAALFGVGSRAALVWLDRDVGVTRAWAVRDDPYTGVP